MSETGEMKTLVPKLRFPEFRQSNEPWSRCELSNVTGGIAAGLSAEQRAERTEFPVTRIETIADGAINFERVGFVQPFDGIESFRLNAGDILLSNINSTEHIGKSVLFDSGVPLYHGMNLLRIVPNPGEMAPDFLWFQLSTQQVRSDLRARSNKAVNQASINQTALGKTILAKPALPEQRKIAGCLQSLDGLIAAETEKLEALKRHKKGLLQQLFPAEGETIPRLRFPQFYKDEEWTIDRVGKRCTYFSGGTPDTSDPGFYGGTIPFIRSAEIDKSSTALALTTEALRQSSAKLVSKGDVLFALYGANSGEVALARLDGAINQAVLCLKYAVPTFLYSYLEARKGLIVDTYVQGGQGNLSGEIVASIELAFPSVEEQKVIGEVIRSTETALAHQLKQVELIRTQKAALMQKLFPTLDDV